MKVLVDHWEKLVLLVVIAVVALVVVMALGGQQAAARVDMSAGPATNILEVKTDYAAVVQEASTDLPDQLGANPFTHDWLQRCTACRRLQPRFSLVCPECKATVNYSEDTDGDGMPNKWEQQYGLDWTNPADGTEDADSDGISNAEEYTRQSDPTNPSDPNLVLDEYNLVSVFRPARPVLFMNPSTMQFRYKDRTRFAREGVIRDGQTVVYEVGQVIPREAGVWNPMINATQMVDRSEVELKEVATGTTFTLVRGETNYEDYVEAKLARKSDGEQVVLREGASLPLTAVGKEAVLTEALPQDKSCVFTVGKISYTVTAK
jgi:hypothetical protein